MKYFKRKEKKQNKKWRMNEQYLEFSSFFSRWREKNLSDSN